MKPITVDRNSWWSFWWLMKLIDVPNSIEDSIDLGELNVCQYIRWLLLKGMFFLGIGSVCLIIGGLVFIAMIQSLVYYFVGLTYGVLFNPWYQGAGFEFASLVVWIALIIMLLYNWLYKVYERMDFPPLNFMESIPIPNFVFEAYKAFKEKTCVKIDLK